VFKTHLEVTLFFGHFFAIDGIDFVPLVLPDQTLAQSEVEMVASLGVDIAGMTQTVDQHFATLFIESGLMAKTQAFFTSSKGWTLDLLATGFMVYGLCCTKQLGDSMLLNIPQ